MPLILSFTQSWLPKPEEGFRPGSADISWSNDRLMLVADLIDEEVITTATANQQRLWEHGDVVELFVQRVGESGYREYQVSPNGFKLSLSYPDLTGVIAVRSGERQIDEFFSRDSFIARAELTATGWRARFSIPLPGSFGERIRVSCCRYDAGACRFPIISSTSPHPVRDFHRPQDWREMILMEE
ncbi:MAG: hypothetical protein WCR44_08815 [Verrucomicrobiota bacterium]|jgi:hypothetical protein